jgi:hypothetical protein
MPNFVPPSKNDPVLHPADIFSFINEHRAKSKALCQGPAALLGVALMKEDSWKWVDRRQIGGKTLDYGKECDPLPSLLILSLIPAFCPPDTSLGVNNGSAESQRDEAAN